MNHNSGWTASTSPFHSGERAIQARHGLQDKMEKQGRKIIRPYLTAQHRQFFVQLSYLLIGSADQAGNLWASIITGQAGFLHSPNDRTLRVKAQLIPGDPLNHNLQLGAHIGLLGIELHTRRRNRLNGKIQAIAPEYFEVAVHQSFGNCPQYIQARTLTPTESPPANSPEIRQFHTLEQPEKQLIAQADTLFIASAYQDNSTELSQGVDVSHRGGKPGFVRLDGDRTLTIPDFAGNNYFNTLGNLELNPKCGLLFIDFSQGDLLYLTGSTELIWSGAEVGAFAGAQQLIRFQLQQGYLLKTALNFNWSAPEFSPFLAKTGQWHSQ